MSGWEKQDAMSRQTHEQTAIIFKQSSFVARHTASVDSHGLISLTLLLFNHEEILSVHLF